MATEQELQIYEYICATLEEAKIKYTKDKRVLFAHCRENGEAFPISCIFAVNTTFECIQLLSVLVDSFPRNRVEELAIAANAYNYRAAQGRIDVDIFASTLRFRNVATYKEREITKEFVERFIDCSITALLLLDRKFKALAKGEIELSDLVTEFGSGGAS